MVFEGQGRTAARLEGTPVEVSSRWRGWTTARAPPSSAAPSTASLRLHLARKRLAGK